MSNITKLQLNIGGENLTLDTEDKFNTGYNEINNVEDLPLDKHLVIANIQGFQHLDFSNNLPLGKEQHIIFPASNHLSGFTLPSNIITVDGKTDYIFKPKEQHEMNLSYAGDSVYINIKGATIDDGVWGQQVDKSEAQAGDICFYDIDNGDFAFVRCDNGIDPVNRKECTWWGTSNGTYPIGVVVVPASHDVYGDGSLSIISLNDMSCEKPWIGFQGGNFDYGVEMRWGGYGEDISELPNLNTVPCIDSNGVATENITTNKGHGFLPSDNRLYGTTSGDPKDPGTYYNHSATNEIGLVPSPYNSDGSRNPLYYLKSNPSLSTNALSDFDGVGNTDAIVSRATAEDWEDLDTLTDSADSGYYPAACCCRLYDNNSGLDDFLYGQWYLPALGELGYLIARYKRINSSIKLLETKIGIGHAMGISDLWSSTEWGEYYARNILGNLHTADASRKDLKRHVRAFLRI